MAGDRGEMREVYLRANLANIFQAQSSFSTPFSYNRSLENSS